VPVVRDRPQVPRQALENVAGEVDGRHAFPALRTESRHGPEGQDIFEHITEKYGSTAAQQEQAREAIRQRGDAVGFTFDMEKRGRIYNTFDAHRLLHWAEGQGASAR
jgi:predicted DsbA family dithiol-disulfide isomerase